MLHCWQALLIDPAELRPELRPVPIGGAKKSIIPASGGGKVNSGRCEVRAATESLDGLIPEEHGQIRRQINAPDLIVMMSARRFDVRVLDAL